MIPVFGDNLHVLSVVPVCGPLLCFLCDYNAFTPLPCILDIILVLNEVGSMHLVVILVIEDISHVL